MTHYTMNVKKIAPILSLIIALALPLHPVMAEFNSMLAPTRYTSANYIPPQYDAFDHDYYYPPSVIKPAENNLKPVATFIVITNTLGLQNNNMGTTDTIFTFDANASTDTETDPYKLEARWDFDGDGKVDSYFSRNKRIQHQYKTPGIYSVTVQILDGGGNISSYTLPVTVVENTDPTGYFTYTPMSGTQGTIFTFNTQFSHDDQYLQNSLVYRFDWDGDGIFDTRYESKTIWNHKFDNVGPHQIILEVKDPGGKTGQAAATITTTANTKPQASLVIREIQSSVGQTFEFDASESHDAETSLNHLRFRWDVHYNGPNDIVYDSAFTFSPRFTFNYRLPGTYGIKLEVMDEEGIISTTFAKITVE